MKGAIVMAKALRSRRPRRYAMATVFPDGTLRHREGPTGWSRPPREGATQDILVKALESRGYHIVKEYPK